MKPYKTPLQLLILLLLTTTIFWSCSKSNDITPTTPTPTPIPNPIHLDTVTLAGFTPISGISGSQVTITGNHFSTTASSNIVKFNGESAVVVSATSTSLLVQVPVQGTTGNITVTVNGITVISTGIFNKITTMNSFVGLDFVLGFTDGLGQAARFKYPLGMAVDAVGNIYIADVDNHSIRKITQAGLVTTFAGNGTAGYVDANGTSAQFSSPYDVVFDSHGNLFVTESYGHRIRKITPSGDVTTFAGNGVPGYVDGTGTAAQFNFPWGITIDANDNLYVCDNNNNRIRKITPSKVVSSFAGNGLSGNNGGDMWDPRKITMDHSGNFYVVGNSFPSSPILKVSPAGIITNFALSVNGAGHIDGDLSQAEFSVPTAIFCDSHGNLYITEEGAPGPDVRKISVTNQVSTIATFPSGSYFSDGIVVDQFDNVFASEPYAKIVVKITQ